MVIYYLFSEGALKPPCGFHPASVLTCLFFGAFCFYFCRWLHPLRVFPGKDLCGFSSECCGPACPSRHPLLQKGVDPDVCPPTRFAHAKTTTRVGAADDAILPVLRFFVVGVDCEKFLDDKT